MQSQSLDLRMCQTHQKPNMSKTSVTIGIFTAMHTLLHCR